MQTQIKLCECGCGQPTPICKYTDKKYGNVKGQPLKFIKGHNAIINIDGHRFGRLIVVGRSERPVHLHSKNSYVLCKCDCGNELVVQYGALGAGNTKSCGCLQRETASRQGKISNTSHGLSKTPTYHAWLTMRQRCENPRTKSYKNYGARGISVCERWQDFTNFIADMGEKPTPKHTVERKNNNGNYEPSNCKWATRKEQRNNTRTNRFVKFNGQNKTLPQWSETLGIAASILRARIDRYHWPIEKALTTPNLGKHFAK